MVFYHTKKLSEFLSSVFTSVPYKVKPFTFISLQGKKTFARTYILNIFSISVVSMLFQTQELSKQEQRHYLSRGKNKHSRTAKFVCKS